MEILVTKIKGNGYFFIPKYAREADSGKFSVSPCVRKKLQVVVSIKCHRLQEGKYNKLRKI